MVSINYYMFRHRNAFVRGPTGTKGHLKWRVGLVNVCSIRLIDEGTSVTKHVEILTMNCELI
jgi:hypothetical protein